MSEDISIDELVRKYVLLRDHRSDLEKQKVTAKTAMDNIAREIHKSADEQGVISFTTPYGTAFKKVSDRAKVDDWDLALNFLIDNDLRHVISKSVLKSAVKEYMEEHDNTPPPGIKLEEWTEVNVRRK